MGSGSAPLPPDSGPECRFRRARRLEHRPTQRKQRFVAIV